MLELDEKNTMLLLYRLHISGVKSLTFETVEDKVAFLSNIEEYLDELKLDKKLKDKTKTIPVPVEIGELVHEEAIMTVDCDPEEMDTIIVKEGDAEKFIQNHLLINGIGYIETDNIREILLAQLEYDKSIGLAYEVEGDYDDED
jgi:hypothetical protein